MQKNETGHHLTPFTKVNSKWIKYLNLRPEIIKLLEVNTEGKFLDISLRDDAFGFDNKGKNKQVGLHQTKNLQHSKGNNQQNEKVTY